MRISEYPAKIKRREQYTSGDIARLFRVSNRTAAKMMDNGFLTSHTIPGGKERRVLHASLEEYVRDNPQYTHVLDRLED